MINLREPTKKDLDDSFLKIYKTLKEAEEERPSEKYLVICLFATHGVIKGGTQQIIVNEYDRRTKFYRLFPAEKNMSNLAMNLSNSYVIGVFACCRQEYDHRIVLEKNKNFDPRSSQAAMSEATNFLEQKQSFIIEENDNQYASILRFYQANNYIYLYGCRPADGILRNSKMIEDITHELLAKINPDTH